VARTRRMGQARVDDVALELAGADPVEAFVIRPASGSARAGALFLHWLGEHHNDRTQFLAEAAGLAALGVRSVLPAGRLPWQVPPNGPDADTANLELEGRRIERAFAELVASLDADAPIAMIGHDFGAMHGLPFAAREPRIGAVVVIAAVPRWADWFLPFWAIEGDPVDYRRRLAPFDPIAAMPALEAELLLQFSNRDFYIAPMTARELARAAGRDLALEWYQADHAMRSSRARASRGAFLRRVLALD
jgi:pimeloyl-ACP methyl ester carboxylesterase